MQTEGQIKGKAFKLIAFATLEKRRGGEGRRKGISLFPIPPKGFFFVVGTVAEGEGDCQESFAKGKKVGKVG